MKYKKFILFFMFLILFLLLLKIKYRFEFFEEQKKIYLISNFKNIPEKFFRQIKINDLVVFMNTSFHSNNKNLDKNEKLLFLRENSKSFWGFKQHFSKKYNKVFFLASHNYNNNNNHIRLFNNFKENKELLNFKELYKDINYTKNKIPTTGFITYLYLKKKYPNSKIILVGFYGYHKDYKITITHDANFEQKYYSDHKITNLK